VTESRVWNQVAVRRPRSAIAKEDILTPGYRRAVLDRWAVVDLDQRLPAGKNEHSSQAPRWTQHLFALVLWSLSIGWQRQRQVMPMKRDPLPQETRG
jgi:hypothetical protein